MQETSSRNLTKHLLTEIKLGEKNLKLVKIKHYTIEL